MAEGHAVIRWAQALTVLVGEQLREVHLPKRWGDRSQTLLGQHLCEIKTHGKVLLLALSGGETLLCHAMQYGSWQVGEPGMILRKDPGYVRLRLRTDHHEAVFYHGPVIELLTAQELASNERLQSLGPDVMAADFDRDLAWQRLTAYPAEPIGDIVMNQQVMAGIGNIYKSEGLFLAAVNPCRPAHEIERGEMERYWNAVIPLMWDATKSYGRTATLPPDKRTATLIHWVYGRKGKPCLRCGTPIEKIRQGHLQRATYFCPQCQPATP